MIVGAIQLAADVHHFLFLIKYSNNCLGRSIPLYPVIALLVCPIPCALYKWMLFARDFLISHFRGWMRSALKSKVMIISLAISFVSLENVMCLCYLAYLCCFYFDCKTKCTSNLNFSVKWQGNMNNEKPECETELPWKLLIHSQFIWQQLNKPVWTNKVVSERNEKIVGLITPFPQETMAFGFIHSSPALVCVLWWKCIQNCNISESRQNRPNDLCSLDWNGRGVLEICLTPDNIQTYVCNFSHMMWSYKMEKARKKCAVVRRNYNFLSLFAEIIHERSEPESVQDNQAWVR